MCYWAVSTRQNAEFWDLNDYPLHELCAQVSEMGSDGE